MISFSGQSGSPARQASVWMEKHRRGESMDGFADWFGASAENSTEFLRMARIVRLVETSPVMKEFDTEAAVAEARVVEREEKERREKLAIKRTALAAMIVGVVVLGGMLVESGSKPEQWKRYSAEDQSARAVTLDDGSRVTLSDGSVLLARMNETERVVDLKYPRGDAFFEVQEDSGRPTFVVEIPAARIEVTGTEFRVKREGEETLVQVEDGSVKVIAALTKEERVGRKGQDVRVRRDGGVVEIPMVVESVGAERAPAVRVAEPRARVEGGLRALGDVVDEFRAVNPRLRITVEGAAREAQVWIDFDATEAERLRRIVESDPELEVSPEGDGVVVRVRD